MMSKKPERVGQVYKKNSHFKWLTGRAQQLDKLNIIFQKCLPLQFINHCRLANINADRAVIHTDNASYASLLRFQSAQICQALSAHLPEPLTRLDVKVRPLSSIQRSSTSTSLHVSTKTAALLDSTAADMEDGPLKTALRKLAKRQSD
jgi:hypothetical protein